MNFIQKMMEKAKAKARALVFPEGSEARTQRAACIIRDENLASKVFLIGSKADILQTAQKEGLDLENIDIVEPEQSTQLMDFAQELYELRKHRGMTLEQAKIDILQPLRWGAMMVHRGQAHALVAGAESTTADVLRAGLMIIGTVPGSKTASSCFVMQMEDTAMIFSDCAVVPRPDSAQLAEIAIAAAKSCKDFLDQEPAVALLSFSTKGSGGEHPDVVKVREALAIVKEREPQLLIDGELQLDTALVTSVCDKKAPGSPVRGLVNTLVFPDLGAGNIGYKLVQRLAKAEAYGPFLQGFAKPISDLSRGCSVQDIVVSSAVSLAQD